MKFASNSRDVKTNSLFCSEVFFEKANVGLLITIPDYYERKRILQEYYGMLKSTNAVCA